LIDEIDMIRTSETVDQRIDSVKQPPQAVASDALNLTRVRVCVSQPTGRNAFEPSPRFRQVTPSSRRCPDQPLRRGTGPGGDLGTRKHARNRCAAANDVVGHFRTNAPQQTPRYSITKPAT
jgi:hypothetical protein